MDKAEFVLKILVGIMGIDGEIDPEEIDEINKFLSTGNYCYDCQTIGKANNMLLLKPEELEKEVVLAANQLKDIDLDEKKSIIDLADRVVNADGVLHPHEQSLMDEIKKIWNMS